jgi:hypothetical protein
MRETHCPSIERRDLIMLLGSGGSVDKHPTEPKSFLKEGGIGCDPTSVAGVWTVYL